MRWILIFFLLISFTGYSQLKDYTISVKGDTLNAVDMKGLKQGKWVHRYDEVRGEPGFEEEGEYKDGRKEGVWRKYTLMGDLIAMENYRWGYKDGRSQYFNGLGELLREENWKALNPDKQYDTLEVEDVDRPNQFKTVVVKNEGAGIRHGAWKYYDPTTGFVNKTEFYVLGALDKGSQKSSSSTAAAKPAEAKGKSKPKEVLEFEKKNAGKKKVRVQDGSTF
jgi:antitoxin component YwqK of YwqJK toxin-antitoxin module